MKKLITIVMALGHFAFPAITEAQNSFPVSGSTGIGTTTPNSSSLLEIKSTTKGLLIPRMTKAQRDAIISPAKGLLIYQTDNTIGVYHYDGSAWKPVTLTNPVRGLNENLYIGQDAGFSITTGTSNTAIGKASQKNNTSISGLVSIGDSSLYANTIGENNTALGFRALKNNSAGNDNVAIGWGSLAANTTGNNNIAQGSGALMLNTIGYSNIGIGTASLSNNLTGNQNIAIGDQALFLNYDGTNNVATGHEALKYNSSGSGNAAYGSYALSSNETGNYNCAIGQLSLYNNFTGGNNCAMGYNTLFYNTNGSFNLAHGSNALFTNSSGSNNAAYGASALYSNQTGNGNTAIGNNALYHNTTATQNTATGYYAMYMNTTGNFNVANGYASLYANTTGYNNTAMGVNSLNFNTIGYGNAATGYNALENNTTGIYNTANGYNALSYNQTGAKNTAMGTGSGNYNDNNTSCTFIGYDADQSVTTDFTNSTALGNSSRITASNQIRLGNPSVNSIGGYAGWTNLSDGRYKKNIREDVAGMAFIRKLRPVVYNLDMHKLSNKLALETSNKEEMNEKEMQIQTGFIAQEVESAAESIGYDFSGVDKPKNPDDLYGLRYAEFVVPMVKAMQELDKDLAAMKTMMKKLQEENELLREALDHSVSSASSKTETGIADKYPGNKLFTISPNPARDEIQLKLNQFNPGKNQAEILDSSGRMIKKINLFESNTTISLDGFAPGTYFIEVTDGNKVIDTQSFVVIR